MQLYSKHHVFKMAPNSHDTATLELFLYCGLTEANLDPKTGTCTTAREKYFLTKKTHLR